MSTIELPYTTELLGGMFAVAQHASKDDVTPIITVVKVCPRFFVATNRHTAGRWEHTTEAEAGPVTAEGVLVNDPDAVVMVPRKAAEWLAKQTPKVLGVLDPARVSEPPYVVVFTPESVTIKYAGPEGQVLAVTRFEPVEGRFPPVERLILEVIVGCVPEDVLPVVSLRLEFLEMFIRGAKRTLYREAPMRFRLTKTENPGKPGPVVITFAGRFVGLLQPNLIVNGKEW